MFEIHPIQLTESDKSYDVAIPGVQIELKQHQRVALERCMWMENHGVYVGNSARYTSVKSTVGVLADSVGSGKSYVMLALIAANESPQTNFNRVNVYGQNKLYVEYAQGRRERWNVNVLVCSFGLIDQWVSYINAFGSSEIYTYFVINRKTNMEEFKKRPLDHNKPTIVLVASSMYHLLAEYLEMTNVSVTRVIFDEADTAPTPKAIPIQSMFYWLVTASYKNVLYPVQSYDNRMHTGILKNTFLRNIFLDLVKALPYVDKQNILSRIVVKNNDEFVKMSYMLPSIQARYIICRDPIAEMLNGVTHNSMIIRAINAGDIESAINILDKNNKGDENHIMDLVMSDLKKDLHNCVQTIQYTEQIIMTNADHKQERLNQLRRDEEKIKEKIELLTNRIKESTYCLICYSEPQTRSITKCCQNTFCFECIGKWLGYRSVCPLCKATIDPTDDLMLVTHNHEEDDGSENGDETTVPKKMSKFDTLSKLLMTIKNGNAGAKILIFSEYDRTFDKIASILDKLHLKHGMLKGPGLMKNMERFKRRGNSNHLDVLMINSTAYGSGMNLENSTDVILFHNFNQQIENQVIGRAQRPGRRTPLNVWYLFNESEKENFRSELNSNIEAFSFS